MSTDELPKNAPLTFNTFSGQDVPIDAYNLLSAEEAEKKLTEEEKEEYKDPEFQLVIRSRIWKELKNSVEGRREMYKERLKLREAAKQNANNNTTNENDSNVSENEVSNDANEEHNSESQQKHVITPPTHSSENHISNGYTFIDNESYNNYNKEPIASDNTNNNINNSNESYIIDNNKFIESDSNIAQTVFANPFNPLDEPLNNNMNNNYAIPYDNNTEIDNDIWANWSGGIGGQYDTNDNDITDKHVNNSSNDSIPTNKNSDVYSNGTTTSTISNKKVRKSEVFLDPFHWDTDDENIFNDNDNENDINENEIGSANDMIARTSMLLIDVNAPFKDPFHNNHTPMNASPNDNEFANPFDNISDHENDDEKNSTENMKKNEDILRLLFGDNETIPNDENDNNKTLFADPFHNNNSEQITLSPMIQFNQIQINANNEIVVNNNDNDTHMIHSKPSISPIIANENMNGNVTSNSLQVTPVPINAKRDSAINNIDTEKMAKESFDEQNETEYNNFPDIDMPNKSDNSDEKHIETVTDEKKEQKSPVVPVVKKKNSLSFSWSDNSQDSLYGVVKQPTPPPPKTMNDELYELLAQLLEKTIQKPKCHYFTEGVPWEKWKCFDWPQHVKQPETLIQVREALNNNQYETPGQFAESVRNVFRNYTTYHWKGAGQYRVNTKAGIMWEDFNIEYFQVLADESEERKREESRQRAIDEAKQNSDPREREFSNTHTHTSEEDEEEEEIEIQKDVMNVKETPLHKHVSFNDNIAMLENDEDEEFAAMAKMHFEMSQHLSTHPNTPAYTPQPPLLDFHSNDSEFGDVNIPNNSLPLATLLSSHELMDNELKDTILKHTGIQSNNSHGLHVPSPQPDISRNTTPNSIRRTAATSPIGAVSLTSPNVRFQNPEQAQRALKISNVLHHREESISRMSNSSLSNIFRLKKGRKGRGLSTTALLARISSNVPFGFDPKRRRGEVIGNTRSHRSLPQHDTTVVNNNNNNNNDTVVTLNGMTDVDLDAGDTCLSPTEKTALQSRDSSTVTVDPGKRHRPSKELVDEFSPTFRSEKSSELKKFAENKPDLLNIEDKMEFEYNLEENDIPEQSIQWKYYGFIVMFFSVVMVINVFYYRLFSDQKYAFLYPIENIGSRILAVFIEPLFIICVLGSIIVIHMQYRPGLVMEYKKLFMGVFIVLNILNVLRVILSSCKMDFIYDLYVYLVVIFTMIVPFFSFGEKWKESETIFLLFLFWMAVVLIGFVFVIIHKYVIGFIFVMFYSIIFAWIIRFFYYKSLGIFDNIGNLSSKYDIGYCSLLIPCLLLFQYFGSIIVISINRTDISYNIVLLYIFCYYILLKLTFVIGKWLWEITALRATDQLKYVHLMFPIFFMEELLDIFLLINLKFSYEIIGLLILMTLNHIIRDSDIGYKIIYKKWIIPTIFKLYYGYYNRSKHKSNLRLLRSQSSPENEVEQTTDADQSHTQIELDINEEDMDKELNLAQERDDIHLARITVHFQMLKFVEYASRIAILILLIMDIICDEMNIGNRLIILNESNRGLIILLCVISIILIYITNIISQFILSKQALTTIQLLDKIPDSINDFSSKERLYIHMWVIFGDECEIFKRFWIFFAFTIGYQLIVILQAQFSVNGLVSVCDMFF